MKTIFITVSRGFIMRNVLRSGVLEYLKEKNLRIVIFIMSKSGDIPQYLRDEFEDGQIVLEGVRHPKASRFFEKFYKLFVSSVKWLVYKKFIRKIRKARKTSGMFIYFELPIFIVLSKISFLKGIARYVEYNIFKHDFYAKYFDKYNPSLVFSTSIVSRLDITMMKEAKRRGVKTVSMPKGWDNITKQLYRFIPDMLIVQNEEMKKGAIKEQKVDKEKIKVCGFPQFDWYRRENIIMSREEYFSKIGLDPSRRLIFFGSEGFWVQNDENIAKMLIEVINDNKSLVKPSSLLIRSHFSDAKIKRFKHYEGIKNVFVDDNFSFSDIFHDSCDPDRREIIQFVNTMYHSDIVISFASTLSLDAACLLKPNINPAFDIVFDEKTGKDISLIQYEHDHFQDVLETGAIDLVQNKEEFINTINEYLIHPEYKKEKRQNLLDKMCYRVDGKSSKRIADVILSMLE